MVENAEQKRRLILTADQKLFAARAFFVRDWVYRGSATKRIKRYQNVQKTKNWDTA